MKNFSYRIKVSTGACFIKSAIAHNQNAARMELCYELNALGVFPEECITSISLLSVGIA
jgi:hypothetical protein